MEISKMFWHRGKETSENANLFDAYSQEDSTKEKTEDALFFSNLLKDDVVAAEITLKSGKILNLGKNDFLEDDSVPHLKYLDGFVGYAKDGNSYIRCSEIAAISVLRTVTSQMST